MGTICKDMDTKQQLAKLKFSKVTGVSGMITEHFWCFSPLFGPKRNKGQWHDH
jgi:hypothetical protein